MRRSGYSDDGDNCNLWRGAVQSAIKGKRGQKLLIDMAEALDAMPDKRLVTEELQIDGEFCALGALGDYRRIDLKIIDPDNYREVARIFNIPNSLAQEIVYENDEGGPWNRIETPEQRWLRMRRWVQSNITEVAEAAE